MIVDIFTLHSEISENAIKIINILVKCLEKLLRHTYIVKLILTFEYSNINYFILNMFIICCLYFECY